jgi:hypothetical protein
MGARGFFETNLAALVNLARKLQFQTNQPKAFGWNFVVKSASTNDERARFCPVLKIPPVDSPETAVKMAIYSDIKRVRNDTSVSIETAFKANNVLDFYNPNLCRDLDGRFHFSNMANSGHQ